MVGSRPAKQQVAVIQSTMNHWKLDGVTAWPAAPDRIDAIDATPFGTLPIQQAFDVSRIHTAALLRRANRQENINARGECHVHFERERLLVSLDLLVGNGADVALPSGFPPCALGCHLTQFRRAFGSTGRWWTSLHPTRQPRPLPSIPTQANQLGIR